MKLLYLLLLNFIFYSYSKDDFVEFTIVIASYNNAQFYKQNLDSVTNQKTKNYNSRYPNYKIIYIDDCSTDGTGTLVDDYIEKNSCIDLVKVIHNKNRMGHLYNQYNAIHSCKNNEVIVIVDGDDFLIGDYVLDHLNKVYQDNNVWLTYGQFLYWPMMTYGFCQEIPKSDFENKIVRKNWYSSHLRTFYAGLFKQIKKEDLYYQGKFFESAVDIATMYPMLEMAGFGHVKFIPTLLCLYNASNPCSFEHSNKAYQTNLAEFIRTKSNYSLANDKTIFGD